MANKLSDWITKLLGWMSFAMKVRFSIKCVHFLWLPVEEADLLASGAASFGFQGKLF